MVSLVTPASLTVDGRIEDCGEVRVEAGDLQIGAGGAMVRNQLVGIAVAGRLESSGSVGQNGDVHLCTGAYLLRSGHDFDGNDQCRLFGSPEPGSQAAAGCLESGPCAMPLVLAPPPPSVSAGCGAGGQPRGAIGPGLIALALLLLRRRRGCC